MTSRSAGLRGASFQTGLKSKVLRRGALGVTGTLLGQARALIIPGDWPGRAHVDPRQRPAADFDQRRDGRRMLKGPGCSTAAGTAAS